MELDTSRKPDATDTTEMKPIAAIRSDILRIEMSLDEACSLYRLLVDSTHVPDGSQLCLIRTLREFLIPRLALSDIEASDALSDHATPERQ